MTQIKMTIEPKLPVSFKYVLEDGHAEKGDENDVRVEFVNEGLIEDTWYCKNWYTAMKLARDLLEKDVQVAIEG